MDCHYWLCLSSPLMLIVSFSQFLTSGGAHGTCDTRSVTAVNDAIKPCIGVIEALRWSILFTCRQQYPSSGPASESRPQWHLQLPLLPDLQHSIKVRLLKSAPAHLALNNPFLPTLWTSVSDVLHLCSEDPEETLYHLGFGCDEPQVTTRIPPRFFTFPSVAQGINFRLFLDSQLQRIREEDPGLSLASKTELISCRVLRKAAVGKTLWLVAHNGFYNLTEGPEQQQQMNGVFFLSHLVG